LAILHSFQSFRTSYSKLLFYHSLAYFSRCHLYFKKQITFKFWAKNYARRFSGSQWLAGDDAHSWRRLKPKIKTFIFYPRLFLQHQ